MFSLITVSHITPLISYSVLAVLVILGTLNTILCNVISLRLQRAAVMSVVEVSQRG